MKLEWKEDKTRKNGEWNFYASLPDGWKLSVLRRFTGFGFWEIETALINRSRKYCEILLGDIRDVLNGGETFEEIRTVVEGGPKVAFEQLMNIATAASESSSKAKEEEG